jgi:hypothetical protein
MPSPTGKAFDTPLDFMCRKQVRLSDVRVYALWLTSPLFISFSEDRRPLELVGVAGTFVAH